MILIDTREKKNEHIRRYLEEHNIEYRLQKLDTGDYMNTDYPNVIVDRKQNLDECAQNLYSHDSGRFWRELRRAHEAGTRLVFLVEHGSDIRTINDVPKWTCRFSEKITGRKVFNEMFRAHLAYHVDWKFCDKPETAKRILEIIHYEC